jgi:hypothetical protein
MLIGCSHFQIFVDGHVGEELPAFGHEHQSHFGLGISGQFANILSVELDCPTPGRDQPHNRAQQCRFARAVAAHQASELSFFQAEA